MTTCRHSHIPCIIIHVTICLPYISPGYSIYLLNKNVSISFTETVGHIQSKNANIITCCFIVCVESSNLLETDEMNVNISFCWQNERQACQVSHILTHSPDLQPVQLIPPTCPPPWPHQAEKELLSSDCRDIKFQRWRFFLRILYKNFKKLSYILS